MFRYDLVAQVSVASSSLHSRSAGFLAGEAVRFSSSLSQLSSNAIEYPDYQSFQRPLSQTL